MQNVFASEHWPPVRDITNLRSVSRGIDTIVVLLLIPQSCQTRGVKPNEFAQSGDDLRANASALLVAG